MCPIIEADMTEALGQVTAGEYPARVLEVTQRQPKDPDKKPYLNWTLETFGKDDSRLNGLRIYHITPASGKGAGILEKFLKVTGVPFQKTGERLTFDTDHAGGKEVVVTMAEETWNGQSQMRVKAVRRYGDATQTA